MTEGQKRIIAFCEDISENARAAGIENVEEKLSRIAEAAREQELIVPVVGSFSAGKSTLVNNIIGSSILPTAVTPETSLATELRYAPAESIEAVKKDGSCDRYTIEEINTVKDKAAGYSYMRLYLNNAVLKELAPLVLVDMPGFDSPLDQHNKAINEYLERGCHYVVLSSSEEGTVTKTMLRRLRFIDEFDRSFTFFLSKANLRPEGTIKELIAHYEEIIEDNLDIKPPVIPLGNESGADVVAKLKNIDVDALFLHLYRRQLKETCFEFIEAINIRIKASKTSLEENDSLIREMEESVVRIQKKADELVADIHARYSSKMIVNVVNKDVSYALESSIDELTNEAVSGQQDAVTRRLNEIVNQALMTSVKNNLSEINERITEDFAEEVSGIGAIMQTAFLDDNYVQNLANSIQEKFNGLQNLAGKLSDPKLGAAWKAISGVLAITTNIVAPLIEVIIFILPEILGPIIKSFQEKKMRETVRTKLLTQVFPEIKQRLQEKLAPQIDGQIKIMVEQVQAQYAEKIAEQRAEIDNAVALKKTSADEMNKTLAALEETRSNVQRIVNAVMEA